MLAVAALSHAQEFNAVSKNRNYLQTGAATVVADPSAPFSFGVASARPGTVTIPGGATFPLAYNDRDENYGYSRSFATQAALDAAFPNGTYVITRPGFATLTLTLTGDLYPIAPQVTGGTYNAGGALLLAPNVATTLNFNTHAGYATAGVAGSVRVELGDADRQTFSVAIPAFGIVASPQPATSLAVPGNELPNNSARDSLIEYSTFTMFDTTTVNGFVAAGYGTRLTVAVTSVSTGTGGNPPVITRQPENQTVAVGGRATFPVAVTSGTGPGQVPFYVWRYNGDYINTDGDDPKYSRAANGSLTINNVALTDAGNYAVIVQNTGGMVFSNVAALTVAAASAAPAIAAPPAPQTISASSTVVFTAATTGVPTPTYQWRLNNNAIPGATNATLVIPGATAANAGSYTVVATNSAGTATSAPANLTISASSDFGRIANLSILTGLAAGEGNFTVGIVIGGVGTSGPKPLLVRAVGPTLGAAPFNIPGTLPDPKLDFFSGTTVVASNDNWGGTAALTTAFGSVGAFPYVNATSRDAAYFNPALTPGAYTIQVGDAGTGTGSVIAELYDATPGASFTATTPRLVNVSVLKQIPAGAILTAGFVIGGSTAKTVLIRAVGPTLGAAPFNIPGAMADPQLVLFNAASAQIATNDNWGGDAQLTAAGNAVGAFALSGPTSRDAILLATLPPGNYTAQASGVGSTAGLAIIEVYEVP
jgi:hypothetical protein